MLSRIVAAGVAVLLAPQPQFRSGIERILVDVQVVDRQGQPIEDLGAADFDGRDVLLEQVDSATVVGYCPCPCATVALDVAPSARRAPDMPARTIPNEAGVLNAKGQKIGGIIVFADDGYLSAIEIFDFAGCPISPLPPVDRLELGRFEEQTGEVRRTWLGRIRRGRGSHVWRPLS